LEQAQVSRLFPKNPVILEKIYWMHPIRERYICFSVKPKNKCPPYSTTISGDICICNPGYSMSNTGKRACIGK